MKRPRFFNLRKGTMQSTTSYGMFRTIPGNRQVDPNHVKRLVAAIEKKNLLSEFPILVNERLEVIDGQNRLIAASTLSVPIFYQIVKGLDLTNVMDINTASKSWSIRDFVISYIELGNSNYTELLEFVVKYKTAISLSAHLLSGKKELGGRVSETIRSGKFQVNTRHMAAKTAGLLSELVPYAEFSVLSDRALSFALWDLIQTEGFDSTRLLGKLKTHALIIKKKQNVRYYLLEIEEIYNYNAKDRVTLYRGQV